MHFSGVRKRETTAWFVLFWCMGVRGLSTVVTERKLYCVVDLVKMRTDKCREIAMDTSSMYYNLLNNIEWRFGCPSQGIKSALEQFILPFLKEGLDFVFFIDGVNEEKKDPTSDDRKIKKSELAKKFTHELINGPYIKYSKGKIKPCMLQDVIFASIRAIRESNPGFNLRIVPCCGEADAITAYYAANVPSVSFYYS